MSRSANESGYVMAALLVALNIMAILLTVALPLWKTAVQREKEAELIWRGSQYARAIDLFRRKYANANPPNLDILLNERFLRKKYKDPMTKDGEFLLVPATAPAGAAGPRPPGTPGSAGAPGVPGSPIGQRPQGPAGAQGGIIGVVSKSTDGSLRVFNGRSKYNEWVFTPQTVLGNRAAGSQQPGPPGGPGANRPGPNMPGGVPGGVRPVAPRPPNAPPGSFPPFGQPQPQQPRPRPPFGLPRPPANPG